MDALFGPRDGGGTIRADDHVPELVGRVSAPEISADVWRSLEYAIRHARDTFDKTTPRNELLQFLVALREGVRCVSAGEAPRLDAVPHRLPIGPVLDCIRRTFVDLLGDDARRNAWQAVQVLSALGRIQCLLDAAAARNRRPSPPDDSLRVVAEVAHDMRSPASAILFMVDVLRSGRAGPVNARQSQQLALIYTAALGLNELAGDLVDLVRGVDKVVEEQPHAFSISQLLRSVSDVVRPMAEEKQLTLNVVEPQADVRVGHPAALSRILLNLTTNAVKFTEQGFVSLIARDIAGSLVEFAVQDSGRGIPSEVLPQLFEPFRPNCRVGSAMFSSSGLGLCICQKLVRALGSELHVSTCVGQGTRFSFGLDLPIAMRC